jgi:hypothetical protein
VGNVEFTGPVLLCRVWKSGDSMVLTIDRAIRETLGLVPKDVIGFRLVKIQGKTMLLGEKIPLHKIAQLAALPADALPTER